MRKQKKVLWLPEFLKASERARAGLGVLVSPGQEPKNALDYRLRWEQRVQELWDEDEDPENAELVRTWEDLEGGRKLVWKVNHLLGLVDGLANPSLWPGSQAG